MEKQTAHSWLGVAASLVPLALGLTALFAIAFSVKHAFPAHELSQTQKTLGLVIAFIALFGGVLFAIWREEKVTYGGQPVECDTFTVTNETIRLSESEVMATSADHCVDVESSDGHTARLVATNERVHWKGVLLKIGDVVTLKHQKAKDPNDKRVRVLKAHMRPV